MRRGQDLKPPKCVEAPKDSTKEGCIYIWTDIGATAQEFPVTVLIENMLWRIVDGSFASCCIIFNPSISYSTPSTHLGLLSVTPDAIVNIFLQAEVIFEEETAENLTNIQHSMNWTQSLSVICCQRS